MGECGFHLPRSALQVGWKIGEDCNWGRWSRGTLSRYWDTDRGAIALRFREETSRSQSSPLFPGLWSVPVKSQSDTLQVIKKASGRRRKNMADQFGAQRSDGALGRCTEAMGRAEESCPGKRSRGEFVNFGGEEKEKEKEREEERQGEGKGCREQQKESLWRENQGEEECRGSLRWNRSGPLRENQEEGEKTGKKKAEENKRGSFSFIGKFSKQFWRGRWHRDHGRQVSSAQDQRHRTWMLSSRIGSADEASSPAGDGSFMGNGRGRFGSSDDAIRQDPPGTESLGRTIARSNQSRLHRGFTSPEQACRSFGCSGPALEVGGDGVHGSCLEPCPKSRNTSSGRSADHVSSRDEGSYEGSQRGRPCEASSWGLGKRAPKGKVQRPRQRKGRQRKKQGEGGSEERRMKQKEGDGRPKKKPRFSDFGEIHCETLEAQQKREERSSGREANLPEASFHSFPEAAATADGVLSCTDFGVAKLDKPAHDSLGLGRAVRQKDCLFDAVELGMGDIFCWMEHRLDSYLDGRLCKVAPSGKVFPLPSSFLCLSSAFPSSPPEIISMLRCLVLGLNSLNGEGLNSEKAPSKFQVRILKGLLEDCERIAVWEERMTPVSWGDFFAVRGVDYKGDEILNAQPISWASVRPALPTEVGQVPLVEVVQLGTRLYVERFEDFLLPVEDQVYTKPPAVKVAPEDWECLCENLLSRGVFDKIHEDDVYKVQGKPVLNGLFGVSKHEFEGQVEIMRVIMNLVPANKLCRALDSDIATLPSWSGMSPLMLMPDEDLVISSEDVRCFFYIFRIPTSWFPLMAFNRALPERLSGPRPGLWYPCSAVLPMGFKNSVSIAQHIHRGIANQALKAVQLGGESEMRKDKPFSRANPLFRIYLDNFDELRRVSKSVADLIEGKPSSLVLSLREEYSMVGVPRHPKKAVATSRRAEVQGAVVDGSQGIAFPKPEKFLKYSFLACLVLRSGECTQKQAQVIGGGLVYLAMFRRPLLGALNHLWKFIQSFAALPPVVRLPLPKEVCCELARFVALSPLAYMDFRTNLAGLVTASDASTTGGGVTMSAGLTPAGCVAASCPVRGDLVEPSDVTSVLTVGLFDGIGALRVAADVLGWNVVGHVGVEKAPEGRRVVESRFPNSHAVTDVADITEEMVLQWSLQYSQVGLVLLGAGPPCQGVSGLNAARKGALRDSRSSLFTHVARVRALLRRFFPWAQVQSLMESVASMDSQDEEVMSSSFGSKPWAIDAQDVSLARRPRLYWVEWEIAETPDVQVQVVQGRHTLRLVATVDAKAYLFPGWLRTAESPLPTFTTSRPRGSPGYKPAGIHNCTAEERKRWTDDLHRFPPYQYQTVHCLQNKAGELRLPSIEEREVILGFPKGYTTMCMPKAKQGSVDHQDCRLTLLGNTWSVPVISFLLAQLGERLGLNPRWTPQDIVQRCAPGASHDFYTFLQRPPMKSGRSVGNPASESALAERLLTSVSVKGEDILLKAPSEDMVRYQRLRASVPSKLWRWRTVCGWKWSSKKEHINVLEMRAVLTALRWRLERKAQCRIKFIHLVDSLVCLHSLSRGRSSSLKLKRSLLRINSLLLATHCQAVWAYVHTKDNPADAPSRAPRKRKWTNA